MLILRVIQLQRCLHRQDKLLIVPMLSGSALSLILMQELILIARVERAQAGLGKLTIQRTDNMLGVVFLLLSVIQLSSSQFAKRSSQAVIDFIKIGLRHRDQ